MKKERPEQLPLDRVEQWESRISQDAKKATDAARAEALAAGLDVLVIRDGHLVRLSLDGRDEVVGRAPQRVPLARKTYKLLWRPPLPG